MSKNRPPNRFRNKQQRGMILLFVTLLVVMFTGLGLLAMRHVRAELRSAGAYMDSLQAAAAAESALAMVATDMRENFSTSGQTCTSYHEQFNAAEENGLARFQTHFSSEFDAAGTCVAGVVPNPVLSGSPTADTTALSAAEANVTITHDGRIRAHSALGSEIVDDTNTTQCWYYYTTSATANYGEQATLASDAGVTPLWVRGHAVARARMYIGPEACATQAQ